MSRNRRAAAALVLASLAALAGQDPMLYEKKVSPAEPKRRMPLTEEEKATLERLRNSGTNKERKAYLKSLKLKYGH